MAWAAMGSSGLQMCVCVDNHHGNHPFAQKTCGSPCDKFYQAFLSLSCFFLSSLLYKLKVGEKGLGMRLGIGLDAD